MGRVFSLKHDQDGNPAGFAVTGQTNGRDIDAAGLARLETYKDPGNSAEFFKQQLAELKAPAAKPAPDLGPKS